MWKTILVTIALLALTPLAYSQSLIERPTAYTSGSSLPFLNPQNAYDGSLATAATASVSRSTKGSTSRVEIWYAFPSAPPGSTGLQLNINWSGSASDGGSVAIEYSLDGGLTFSTCEFIDQNGSQNQHTVVVSLSDDQDLTKVQVKAIAAAIYVGSSTAHASASAYETWISGN